MTGAFWKSAFVAALFALHPLHVESVAWVAERKDVFSTFFWMLTMGSYVWYVERPGASRYLLILLFFILGLMAKPMLVTLPFVLLLLDYWPLGRFQVKKPAPVQISDEEPPKDTKGKKIKAQRHTAKNAVQENEITTYDYQWLCALPLIREKIPLLVFAAASSVATIYAQQKAIYSFDVLPLTVRISNALISYVGYIVKMFWPFNLAVLYPYYGVLSGWKVIGACLLLVFISFMAIRMMRQFPYLIVGWLWYLGILVPVIGLVQVGSQSMADRYTYVPLIGIFIIIAWGVSDLAARWRYNKEALAVASAILLSILIVITWFQVRYWSNSITLFKHAINVTENNSVAHNNLGNALAKKGETAEAIDCLTKAVKINPDYTKAHNNIGDILVKQGRVDEAIGHYTEALRINPNDAKVHNNLGSALVEQGRMAEAIDHFTSALKINPNYTKAHNNMGNILAKQGKVDEAIGHYTKALQINSNDAEAHYNLGITFVERGKTAEAIDCFTKALKINPGYVKAHNNMGNILAKQGKVDEAIGHYAEALRINPDDAKVHNNLGSALVEQGRTAEAIDHFTSALKTNPDYAEAHYNLGNALARQGKLDEAIGHYAEALRINPDDDEARNNFKMALANLKKTGEDIERLQKLLEANPGNPELHYDLGNLYYRKGKLDKAIYQYQQSLSIQPDAVQVLNNLAIVYMTKKEYEKAVATFGEMIDLQPDNADIYYNIACMYSIQNKVEKSIDSLKKAIEKGYDNWILIKTDKDLENIRNSSHYKELMRNR